MRSHHEHAESTKPSIHFLVTAFSRLSPDKQTKCKELGVPVSWLRSSVNARWHVNWRGFGGPVQDLPVTDQALAAAYDLKLPPHFNDEDLAHVGQIIAYSARTAIGCY